ncbi:metal-dependent hydrolase [Bacillus tropicus]|nr:MULTISPECIES: metal-dependent hydrolase [Bacillus]MDF9558156.1 metal-dependent hydrolase [Bacillus tropicus]MDF9590080.1 metal-dependent hydrolase [Bacillus tropicus]
MRGPTHVAAGAALALIAHNYAGIGDDPYLLTATSIIGALITDICHQESTLGRKIPLLSWGINKTFGHRTITQSNLFFWYNGTS